MSNAEILKTCHADYLAWSKEIWDIATTAYLVNEAWVPTDVVHSPILPDQVTWSFDNSRHLIRSATFVHRNPISRDFFAKLASHSARPDS